MHKKTEKNPLGAGRNKNTWTSTRRLIPDPIWSEIKVKIEKWKEENK